MTTLAHALSAGLIAVTAAPVAPTDTRYIAAALIAGAIADVDHVVPIARDWKRYRKHGFRGNLHAARTPVHEMPGLLLAGVIGGLLWFIDPVLAFVIFVAFALHLAQDMVMGRAIPFQPFDFTEIQMFAAGFRHKLVVDVLVIAASVILWILFLGGRV